MVWCRAGLRSENLSVYNDFFTSHEPSKTSETRMHYTMCCGVVHYFSSNLAIILYSSLIFSNSMFAPPTLDDCFSDATPLI
jgi:hypothetical protein